MTIRPEPSLQATFKASGLATLALGPEGSRRSPAWLSAAVLGLGLCSHLGHAVKGHWAQRAQSEVQGVGTDTGQVSLCT